MFDFLGDAWDFAKGAAPYVFPVPYFANKLAGGALGIGGGPDVPGPAPILAPPPPPDLTDLEVQRARISARQRALMGQGIGSSFFSGPLGDGSAPSTSTPNLTGT